MKLNILAVALMVLGLAGILVCTILRVHETHTDERIDYAVLMDAGSTSTKAYIYQWRHKTTSDLPFVSISLSKHNEPRSKSMKPGIATLSPNANVTMISDYLEPLIEWAADKIPDDLISSTPIFLQGTGGLRQLSAYESGVLLTSVRFKLQASGFYFENTFAQILTGEQEAGYGFVAVNALFDRFGTNDLYGSLDMGGVSAEIAFPVKSVALNSTFNTIINGTRYSAYYQSSDLLGVNSARYSFNTSLYLADGSSTIIDPCVPQGYIENVTTSIGGVLHSYLLLGGSNYDTCKLNVDNFVQGLTSSLPRPPSIGTFVTSDKYIKVKDFFNLKDNANIVELSLKLSSFCLLSLADAKDQHKGHDDDVQTFCFMGTYMASLLTNFYQLSTTQRHISWKDSVNHSPVTWTLGSVLDYANQLTPDTHDYSHTHRITRFYHTDGGMVTLFISVLFFILGAIIFILHRRKSSEYVLIQ